jgi:hypothetical protein
MACEAWDIVHIIGTLVLPIAWPKKMAGHNSSDCRTQHRERPTRNDGCACRHRRHSILEELVIHRSIVTMGRMG